MTSIRFCEVVFLCIKLNSTSTHDTTRQQWRWDKGWEMSVSTLTLTLFVPFQNKQFDDHTHFTHCLARRCESKDRILTSVLFIQLLRSFFLCRAESNTINVLQERQFTSVHLNFSVCTVHYISHSWMILRMKYFVSSMVRLKGQIHSFLSMPLNNTHRPICTLKSAVVTLIVPPVHTSPKDNLS